MISLNWTQVNAWRLAQQGLSHRSQPGELIQAVRKTLGIHAQVMSAAEMAIAARVDGLSPQEVQSALWRERTLIKTWAMRQALHLIPSDDFPTYIAARQLTDLNWPVIFDRFDISKDILERYLVVSAEILGSEPITRQQFAEAVNDRLKSRQLDNLLKNQNWGTPFKPLALHGELCFGPGAGQNSTFVRPGAWIGGWRAMDPELAMQEIVRRYLRVYGPTRPRNFQVWWWMTGSAAKKAFDSIAGETEEVDVEGWRAIALKDTIHAILEMEPTREVHLLPSFDVYTIGLPHGKDQERVISKKHQQKVYRPQGWVSAVVLVDGFINGTWEYKMNHSEISIVVNMFSSFSNGVKDRIAIEAERLGKFLSSPVTLEFSQD